MLDYYYIYGAIFFSILILTIITSMLLHYMQKCDKQRQLIARLYRRTILLKNTIDVYDLIIAGIDNIDLDVDKTTGAGDDERTPTSLTFELIGYNNLK